MAQDFGDEMGDGLKRFLSRLLQDGFREWLYAHRQANGKDAGQRDDGAPPAPEGYEAYEASSSVSYVPFGEAGDAAAFARLCQEQGVPAEPFEDRDGNGFVRVGNADLDRLGDLVPRFAEVAPQEASERVARALDEARQLTPEDVRGLKAVTRLPDMARGTEAAARAVNRTQAIADKVRSARHWCHTFDEFKGILARDGIGVTTTKDGENMFYEARKDADGKLLPYSREARDWAVGAQALKENYDVDATHDWFEKNTPKDWPPNQGSDAMVMTPEGPMSEGQAAARYNEIGRMFKTFSPDEIFKHWQEIAKPEPLRVGPERPNEPQVADGSLDMDGRTPDLNQGIESHDSMDTDTRTMRLEREQNGTDVAPSEVREQTEQALADDRSLASVERDCREASQHLEADRGGGARDIDISDKMSQVR